jgi:hypothetical protein
VVVVLLGVLVVRLAALDGDGAALEAPAVVVPEPTKIALHELIVPAWASRDAESWTVDFKTDLDLLAPLGTGSGNAADWFVAFTKPDGPRYAEAAAAMERRVEGPQWLGKVLPPDDPLLAEAEPWCDLPMMRFYPDHFAIEGWETQIPNLLVPLALARSWVARGLDAEDSERATADFRRAIRLGRLLRQEDVTIIADLVGLACIRSGAEGFFRHAVARGDAEQALVASVTLGEVAPQRLLTSERVSRVSIAPYLTVHDDGSGSLDLPDERLDAAIELFTSDAERRFQGEPSFVLQIVRELGTPDQRRRAVEALEEATRSDDLLKAALARWCLTEPVTEELLRESAKVY